jgi:lantibiotic leader peptide-processing serine protease
MRLNRVLCWSGSLLLVGLTACQPDSAPTSPSDSRTDLSANKASKQSATYLISFAGTAPDLEARLQRAGGRVKNISRDAGVASVVSDAPDFAQQARTIPGVEGVGRDRVIQWVDPNMRVRDAGEATGSPGVGGASIGDNETFFGLQWAPKAIHAPEAWDAGARGTGVRVAVLDGGLNNTHIDLNGSIDVACSVSMVEGFDFNQDVPGFSHATHVAGIIAARDNGVGTIGIAPGATIIGVKVLQAGRGSFEDIIDGILYAANPASTPGKEGCARADIINMSLGATVIPAPEDKDLLKALDKATTYADKQGVTVIASAGNDGLNLDQERRVVTVPAQSARVIAVSATGPVGFALGVTNFTRPASYTNFGKAIIEMGAPGGDGVLPGDDLCTLPLPGFGTITNFCWAFDLVVSPASIPSNTGYFFAAGTSMAAPAVAGVAALIIEKHGGSLEPAQVKAALRQSADDLGKPGNDVFYGHGFVNALRAVQ